MSSAGQELGKGVVDSTDSGTLRNLAVRGAGAGKWSGAAESWLSTPFWDSVRLSPRGPSLWASLGFLTAWWPLGSQVAHTVPKGSQRSYSGGLWGSWPTFSDSLRSPAHILHLAHITFIVSMQVTNLPDAKIRVPSLVEERQGCVGVWEMGTVLLSLEDKLPQALFMTWSQLTSPRFISFHLFTYNLVSLISENSLGF